VSEPAVVDSSPCLTCGACCAYSADWPRFWTETDDDIARIPPGLLTPDQGAMACTDDRCRALLGRVGERTACAIYDLRPEVCRDCMPGDDACAMARERFGLSSLAAADCP